MYTTCLWGNYIFRERKVLRYLKLVCLPMLHLRRFEMGGLHSVSRAAHGMCV